MRFARIRVASAVFAFICVFSTEAAHRPKPTEQKSRVGNWYYISGIDRMFGVPRFVAAVHDTQARTSLIFTCQGRPGIKLGTEAPMMGMTLGDAIGAAGAATPVAMRLDGTSVFETTWSTNSAGESRLEDAERTDPLELLFRIASNNHQMLMMETPSRRLQFELNGASTVLFQMLDTCVKPVAETPAKSAKRRRK